LEPGSKKHPRALENLHASSLSGEFMFDGGLIRSINRGYVPQAGDKFRKQGISSISRGYVPYAADRFRMQRIRSVSKEYVP
jgi:hypothetical protein